MQGAECRIEKKLKGGENFATALITTVGFGDVFWQSEILPKSRLHTTNDWKTPYCEGLEIIKMREMGKGQIFIKLGSTR